MEDEKTKIDLFKDEIRKIGEYKRTYLELMNAHKREVIIANLLAYYFKPMEEHGLKDIFIKALLNTIYYELNTAQEVGDKESKGKLRNLLSEGFNDDEFIEAKVKVEESDNEDKKRLDLLISTKSYAIGIEFKINHELNNPLKIYQDMINSHGYSKGKRVLIVLTPYKKELKEDALDYYDNEKGIDKEVEFKQVILSHFIENVKDLLPVDINSMKKEQRWYLIDFIQTIENRSKKGFLKEKFNGVLKKFGFELETLPYVNISAYWNDYIEKAKTKELSEQLDKSEYHSNRRTGFVLVKLNNEFDIKVRLKDGKWHIEKWNGKKKIEVGECPTLPMETTYIEIIKMVDTCYKQ